MSITKQHTERGLFEAAAESRSMDITLLGNSKTLHMEYAEVVTEQFWQDWQAARAPLLSAIAQQGEALEQIATYPMTRAQELSAESMRKIDPNERRVWYQDCETELEAFDALTSVIERWDDVLKNLKHRATELSEAEKFNIISRAAKRIDEAWKRKTRPPIAIKLFCLRIWLIRRS